MDILNRERILDWLHSLLERYGTSKARGVDPQVFSRCVSAILDKEHGWYSKAWAKQWEER